MDWDALCDRLRHLGGSVENIRMGDGQRGRGLFPIVHGQPSRLFLPAHLLVPAADVRLKDGRLTLAEASDVTCDLRDFFEAFQQHFSFGSGAASYGKGLIRARAALSHELQDFLLASDASTVRRFPTFDESVLLRWFLQTRSASFPEHPAVLMPVVELVNHDRKAAGFNWTGDGVEISGTYEDEVLVNYRAGGDSWTTYLRWGFFDPSDLAFSIGFTFAEPAGWTIKIVPEMHCSITDDVTSVRVTGNKVIELRKALLVNRAHPEQPRRAFCARLAPFGLDNPSKMFDMVRVANSQWLTNALSLVKKARNNEHVETLKSALKHQRKLIRGD